MKAPFSIRLIYWLSNVIVALMSMVVIAVLMFSVIDYFGIGNSKTWISIDFPVDVLGGMGQLRYDDKIYDVMFHSGNGRIAISNPPKVFLKYIYGSLMLVTMIGFYFTWTIRKFMKNVKNGLIFELYNIQYLKHLSYGLAAFWFVVILYNRILYHFLAKNIVFDQLRISDDFNYHSGILVAALLIWVLSHIFIAGLKMKEEIDLTV